MSDSTPARPSLLSSSMMIAGLILIAKALGFGRDWLMVQVYGLSTASDAYLAAFQLPQFAIILLGGLGGPFHTATVSVLGKLLARPPEADGQPALSVRRLSALFVSLTGVVFTLISVAVYFWAEGILRVLLGIGSGDATPLLLSATQQLKIMSPLMLIGGVVGIFYGALNVVHVYVWPTLSPTVMSLVMISALLCFPADGTGQLLAWSSLVGAAFQLLLQWPQYKQKGFGILALRPNASEKEQLGDWLHLLLPALLGTTMGQLITFVDLFFASKLPEGGWTAITLANRILQLPIGVLQTALLVPLFPRLVELVAQKDSDTVNRLLVKGVGSLWLISLPLLWVLAFASEPLIHLVFAHGRFDAGDSALVSLAVVFQLGQLLPYFIRDTLTRLFYAYGDSRTPLFVGMAAIGVKFGLNWLFIDYWKAFQVEGITLSITLVTLFNMSVLGWLIRRKHGAVLPWRAWGSLLLRLLLASSVVALPFYALQATHYWEPLPPWQVLWQLPLLALSLTLFYVALLRWVGLGEYVEPILAKFRKR